jgi:hypothetical protein
VPILRSNTEHAAKTLFESRSNTGIFVIMAYSKIGLGLVRFFRTLLIHSARFLNKSDDGQLARRVPPSEQETKMADDSRATKPED